VDQSVAKIGYSYNDAGDLQYGTSYSANGDVLNQVQESYDGLGNVTSDAQSHSGAVSGSTPSVNYSYNQSTGERESMEYPNGRTLSYGYSDVGQISSRSPPLRPALYHRRHRLRKQRLLVCLARKRYRCGLSQRRIDNCWTRRCAEG
jgi:hypothetical protein